MNRRAFLKVALGAVGVATIGVGAGYLRDYLKDKEAQKAEDEVYKSLFISQESEKLNESMIKEQTNITGGYVELSKGPEGTSYALLHEITDEGIIEAIKKQEWYQNDLKNDGEINNPETLERLELYNEFYYNLRKIGQNEILARFTVYRAIQPVDPNYTIPLEELRELVKLRDYIKE